MKILTYYLPQFHEINENNEWWGKGFTEWTNIKKAKSLFKYHEQPIKPLNNNYYNLLDRKTLEWQASLMKKYKIEGICSYHYWFEGRKILEKPMENLLKWHDINLKYCFCWANHDWKKSWEGNQKLLIEQTYSGVEEWEEHINYLMKFFKDPRYIKIENMPLFLIYSSKDIPNYEARIEFYKKKCIENGMRGIYIIEILKNKNEKAIGKNSNGIVFSEPSYSLSNLSIFQKLKRKVLRKLGTKIFYVKNIEIEKVFFKKFYQKNKKNFLGFFNGWDNTPRHKKRGYVIQKFTDVQLKKILLKQKKWMKENEVDYLFFNAWNEWAEGMYLEPDEKNGYKYLEIIKEVIETEV